MSFELIFTPFFEKELKQLAKKYPSIKRDLTLLTEQLIINPEMREPLGENVIRYGWLLQVRKQENPVAQELLHMSFLPEKKSI
jgi:mRNA-degrading endonuclease RelE of RelBE toxin-antitoxin system